MATLRFSDEQLRTFVREIVEQVLAESGGDGTPSESGVAPKHLVVLFSGDRPPGDTVFEQCAALAARGHRLTAVVSHSFSKLVGSEHVQMRLGSGVTVLENPREDQLYDLVQSGEALIVARLSLTAAAKLASGITDSTPTILFQQFAVRTKPILIAQDLATIREDYFPSRALPPRILRTAEDHLHAVEQLGGRFVLPTELERAVTEAFFVPINETPQRLAREKPSKRRQFITAEDVWRASSRGYRELVHEADAIITDEARDSAKRLGVELRSE